MVWFWRAHFELTPAQPNASTSAGADNNDDNLILGCGGSKSEGGESSSSIGGAVRPGVGLKVRRSVSGFDLGSY